MCGPLYQERMVRRVHGVLVCVVMGMLGAGCGANARGCAGCGPCPSGMVAIPAGRFLMGAGAPEYAGQTAHEEGVGAFCLDRTEVTAGAYGGCTSAGCEGVDQQGWCADATEHAEHPRNCVSWEQANAYCTWRGARLPTDAEWEYAARGSDGRLFPWGNEPPDETRARWGGMHGLQLMHSSPVGSYPAGASPFGVLDMAGNVFEWVAPPVGDPSEATYHARGGSYMASLPELVSVVRRTTGPPDPDHTVGFRCALTP